MSGRTRNRDTTQREGTKPQSVSPPDIDLGQVEATFWRAETRQASRLAREFERRASSDEQRVKLKILEGMSLFELGDILGAVRVFREASDLAHSASPELQFSASLAFFSRESQFLSADQALPALSRLRQLAALNANASSLGSLHLVVARLEACRGHCINARRHVELVRTLSAQIDRPVFKALVELVDSGLEMYGGNLGRAINSARLGVRGSAASDLVVPLAGSLTNLGSLSLFTGRTDRARKLLGQALEMCEGLAFTRLSALDSLAQVALQEGALGECNALIEQCRACIGGHNLPARSWYDLAHQLTRCAYFERLEDWDRIVERRRAGRPRARPAAVQGHSHRASVRQGARARAGSASTVTPRPPSPPPCAPVPAAPSTRSSSSKPPRRSALSLRGDATRGRRPLRPRARRLPRHRPPLPRSAGSNASARDGRSRDARPSQIPRAQLDVTDTALLLSDVATMLGAGHSIDLLAHRMAAILQSTTHRRRASRSTSESGCDYQPEPSATWEADADGTFRIRLRGSDRRVAISVRGVQTIDEISLLKSVADLVQVAVNRTADTETEDEDQNLWPRALRPITATTRSSARRA